MLLGITGDTHSDLNFIQIYKAKKQGVTDLIICGDFGYVWDGSRKEQKQLDYMSRIGVNILFIDGNHENHVLLNDYPVEDLYGGKVHKIRDNIFHLMRGEVYNIQGKKFFAFGGANSDDLVYYNVYGKRKERKEGKDWWREEKPTEQEKNKALENLKKYELKVDYILTHTGYDRALAYVGGDNRLDDVSNFLNTIENKVDFKHWFFGHMHQDKTIEDLNTTCVYKQIIVLD